jgi:alkanesulfonate monooxygenase SsuD/methylene tetrahydromethanopterin reductase-like flavin-dependent oxidoreductase (luciferase family)
MIPNHVGYGVWPTMPFPDILHSVKEAESTGLVSAWVVESTLNPSRDCVSILGALAAHTSRIMLGTGIINIFTRTPTLIASTAATLDQMSGGRVILGLGSGHRDQIRNFHSVPFERPLQRMREYVQAIKSVLTNEVANFQGEFVKISGLRLGVRPSGESIPILVASVGRRMAEIAGEVADGAILTLVSPARARELRDSMEAGAKSAGRDPRQLKIACYLPTFLGDNRPSAVQSAKKVVGSYAASPFYRRLFVEMGYPKEARAIANSYAESKLSEVPNHVTEEMAEAITVIGTAEDCRRRIEEYRHAGVNIPILQPLHTGGTIERNVLPALHLARQLSAPT